LVFLKRLITAFFVKLVFWPGRLVLRFVFYKFVVKLYRYYSSLVKKFGWSGSSRGKISFLTNQKLIHFVIVFLTIFFVGFSLTSKTQAISAEELVGKTFLSEIISAEFGVNDQLIEEYFDEEEIISPEQQTYLENLTALKSQPAAEMVLPDEIGLFEETENLSSGGGAIIRPDFAATKKIKRPRNEIVYYVVEPGDTVSTIAEKFEVSVNTILWENNLSAYSLIRQGDKLTILPLTGVIHKVKSGDNIGSIAKNYGVEESAILEANKLAAAGQLKVGQQLIIPGGRKSYYAPASASGYSGLAALRDLLKPGSTQPLSGNKMNWPTVGHYITQYFSWRHYGVDIANKVGTPIYASDTGVVEYAGWGKGYGNQIVIDHGGGKKTRYAHLSKFYCKVGDEVDKGEAIGAMGSTGWSTGSHLHFEVIINGRKVNPLNYVK